VTSPAPNTPQTGDKAVIGAVVAASTALSSSLGFAAVDGHVSVIEAVVVLASTIAAAGAGYLGVYLVPNRPR
jgi:hypothetical protein